MSKTVCPGQDTRYWRPGDIFNVPCGSCGRTIEFFKDDSSRLCPGCGARIQNPKLSLGCALWCEHARECLGYDPKEQRPETGGYDSSLTGSIADRIRTEYGGPDPRYICAVSALKKARDLIKTELVDPAIVLSAVLTAHLDSGPRQSRSGDGSFPEAEKILSTAGMSRDRIDSVISLIRDYHEKRHPDSTEFMILHESYKIPRACN